ncbi:MAG: sarcosine oxidase subunit delta [Rhodobacterales bacterium CG18_big_fil_WC_8_21_14_2_50_71_9]|nr:MAG: sarcosine oxidase subunit delta [Rhodobacterales bacterium CG18_big_fil_WC_8_21_14_2_50_71_9]PIY74038.1 MAG: sarcosine oxidase subunit delta [Rhodobacterales bacterium CG_4_10_14_0_8_um_filter_70_9]PJA60289.1 MAG: sarcosine oxidase subunit delta [Rhodobacterales bacterium CG_4_9_14_3_um_filter_71_31]
MLELTCPACGARAAETELHCGGQAHLTREGPGADDAGFRAYLFERTNPKGAHFERWRHAMGCGKWFHVARDTVTMEVFGVYAITDPAPPEAVLARIAARTGA